MNTVEISSIDLRDYALSLGWKLIPEALKDGLYALNSPDEDYRQLIFPKDTTEADGKDQITLVLNKLQTLYNKTEFQLLEEIRAINDDLISLRYFSNSKSVHSISFEEAIESIEATRQMILAAASSLINPTIYHPRLSRAEPNALLKKIRFRHTQEGSFIIKVSCPFEIDSPKQVTLFGEETFEPYTRKTFSLINRSAFELLNAIESDTLESFIEQQKSTPKPILSYNYCSALLDLYDDERELPFELKFNWSPNANKIIQPPKLPSTVRFSYDIRSKIETAKIYLKPELTLVEDTFIATVESLNGNLDDSGMRFGEVRLAILIESNIVNAKAILDSKNYSIADKAHMKAGAYIRVKGRLAPGKQLRLLENISEFSIID